MGCLFALMAGVFPRLALFIVWVARPARVDAAFDGFLLPLFMVVSTLSPHPGGDSPATLMARRLGLDPSSVSSLQSSVAPPSSARASIGVLGVLLALLTATSFARALQRSYELAWRLPPAGGCEPPGARWPG